MMDGGSVQISPNNHIIKKLHDNPSTDFRREFLIIWGICANSHDVMEIKPSTVDIRLCQLGIHVWNTVDTVTRSSDPGTQCGGRGANIDVDMAAIWDEMG